MRKFIYKHTFPLHHWVVTKRMFKYYEDIKWLEVQSKEEVERYQLIKLKEILEYAYNNIPHYKDVLKNVDTDIEKYSLKEVLRQIPILEKDYVKKNVDQLTNKKYANHKITTSGSTGIPLLIYADRAQLEQRMAMNLRNQEWTGYIFCEPSTRLWHQKIGMSKIQYFKEVFEAWLCRRQFIPVFELNQTNINEVLKQIDKHKSTLIDGYAEAFNILVNHCKRHNLHFQWNKGVSSAQMLYPETRAGMKEFLGLEVFDRYGSREFSGIAQECISHWGKHINSYLYIIEILDDNGNDVPEGQMGNIVITDLHNLATPMIRYKIGDLAEQHTFAPCECGLSWPKMGEIVGRSQSVIITKDGKLVPGTLFDHILKDYYTLINKWQIVQETKEELNIYLEFIDEQEFDRQKDKLTAELKHYLGDMVINYFSGDKIQMTKTGKYEHTISKVQL